MKYTIYIKLSLISHQSAIYFQAKDKNRNRSFENRRLITNLTVIELPLSQKQCRTYNLINNFIDLELVLKFLL